MTALAASLFHVRREQIVTHPPGMPLLTTAPATLPSLRTQVRREQIVTHNPLFAAVVLPNMIKELVGWKKQ